MDEFTTRRLNRELKRWMAALNDPRNTDDDRLMLEGRIEDIRAKLAEG